MIELKDEIRVKDLLTNVWRVFFAHYGRLFPIQAKVIPYIIAGKNVLVKSRAGSGKTEAVVAPLVERLIQETWQGLSILYMVPTRALANDTIKRLQMPLERLDLKICRKTGDHPYEFKEKEPSSILVSTPESLDSLLCRSANIFKHLRALILDELHLLDNTVRGDQLMFLIHRLRGLYRNESHLQFCAMSATFAEGEQQALRYFYPVEVITNDDKKIINAMLFEYKSADDWRQILSKIANLGFRKLIIFCNSRNEVEKIAREVNIAPFKNIVWTHHGSLTKQEREIAESIINEKRVCICVATMTLEFGIDIGDVDAIVLFKPPNSIASILQRIGRGSRRLKDKVYAFGVYSNQIEKLLFEVLFEKAAEGDMDDINYYPRYSVMVQQLFSLMYYRCGYGIRIEDYKKLVQRVYAGKPEIISRVDDIIAHLVEKGFFGVRRGVISSSLKSEAILASPYLHSNIGNISEKTLEVKLIDESRNIGLINEQPVFEGETFTLAGKNWKVVSIDGKSIYVQKQDKNMQENIKKYTHYSYPDLTFKVAQCLKQKIFPQLCFYEFGLIRINEIQLVLFHFLGSLYGRLLELSYRMKYKIKIRDAYGISFIIGSSELFPFILNTLDLHKTISKHYRTLSKHMNLGKYYNYLPISLQRQNIYEGIKIEFLVDYLKQAKAKEMS